MRISDQDDLEWYAATSLGWHSGFGAQLDRMNDSVGRAVATIDATVPGWVEFGRRSQGARARAVALRLRAVAERYAPGATVLLAVHHPIAVALDGVRTLVDGLPAHEYERRDGGRLLALYPWTPTGGRVSQAPDPSRVEERRVAQALALRGRTPGAALRALAAAKRTAKGDEALLFSTIDGQAREMLARALDAWEQTRAVETRVMRAFV